MQLLVIPVIKIIMAGEEDDLKVRGKIHGCDD
ncbi:hypothetical protein [Escherichia phage T2]|uniref:Uncharacterized protein n=1 Tax=Enterobacteria phage T2 TaxID=2060721 RepID=A0A386KE43_BPT2|nr:hypothetical protein [Escherichia phage T2]